MESTTDIFSLHSEGNTGTVCCVEEASILCCNIIFSPVFSRVTPRSCSLLVAQCQLIDLVWHVWWNDSNLRHKAHNFGYTIAFYFCVNINRCKWRFKSKTHFSVPQRIETFSIYLKWEKRTNACFFHTHKGGRQVKWRGDISQLYCLLCSEVVV